MLSPRLQLSKLDSLGNATRHSDEVFHKLSPRLQNSKLDSPGNATRHADELFHNQWTLLREQLNAVSNEVSALRNDVHSIQLSETRLRQEHEAETHQRKDLGAKLEGMIKAVDHQATEERLEMERRCGQFRIDMDAESANRSLLADELERHLQSLRDDLSTEVRARSREQSQASDMLERQRQLLDAENRDRSSAEAGLSERLHALGEEMGRELSSLQAALNQEVAQRTAGDDDRARFAEESQLVTERELRDRKRVQDASAQELQELQLAVKQERGQRETALDGLKAQLTSLRQELSKDKQERMDEQSSLRRAVHAEEGQVTQLRRSLEQESDERRSVLDQLHRRLEQLSGLPDTVQRIQALLQSVSSERSKEAVEFTGRLDALHSALEEELSVRASDDQALLTKVRLATEMVEKESREWRSSVEDVGARLRELSECFGQERGHREAGDAQLRAQLNSCRQELASEKGERADGIAEATRALQNFEGQTAHQLKDLKLCIDNEVKTRCASDEELEARLLQFSTGLRDGVTSNGQSLEEVRRGLVALRSAMEQEAKMRQNEEDNIRSLVQKEMAERGANENALRKSQQSSEEQMEISLVGLRERLQAEVTARGQADEAAARDVRAELTQVRNELSAEGRLRVAADVAESEAMRRSIESLDKQSADLKQTNLTVADLAEALRLEAQQRAEADHAGQSALQEEASARALGDDRAELLQLIKDARQLEAGITGIRSGLEAERNERVAGDEAQSQARRRSLEDEAELRGQGLAQLRTSIEQEAQVRGQGLTQLRTSLQQVEGQLRNLAASLREELSLQEAVVLAVEKRIGGLTEALSHESDARLGANRELRRELEILQANLEKLVADSGQLWKSEVHDLLADLRGNIEIEMHSLPDLLADLRGNIEIEMQRLWEGIDTHTHDVAFDELLSKAQLSPTRGNSSVVRPGPPRSSSPSLSRATFCPGTQVVVAPMMKQAVAVTSSVVAPPTCQPALMGSFRKAYSHVVPAATPLMGSFKSLKLATRQQSQPSLSPRPISLSARRDTNPPVTTAEETTVTRSMKVHERTSPAERTSFGSSPVKRFSPRGRGGSMEETNRHSRADLRVGYPEGGAASP